MPQCDHLKRNHSLEMREIADNDNISLKILLDGKNKKNRKKGYRSELIVIYSYLPKMVGPMAKIKVSALSDINTLCKVGLKNLFFTQKDVDLIKKECVYSNK